jgi:hypothetical protein
MVEPAAFAARRIAADRRRPERPQLFSVRLNVATLSLDCKFSVNSAFHFGTPRRPTGVFQRGPAMTLFDIDSSNEFNSSEADTSGDRNPRLPWRLTFADGTSTDFMACNPNGQGGARVSRVANGRQGSRWVWRASGARKIADGVAPNARAAALAAEDAMDGHTPAATAAGEMGEGYPEMRHRLAL